MKKITMTLTRKDIIPASSSYIKLDIAFFYIALAVFLFANYFGSLSFSQEFSAAWERFRDFLGIIVIVFLTLKILIQSTPINTLLFLLIGSFICALIGLNSGDTSLLFLILFICAGKDVNLRGIAKTVLTVSAIVFLLDIVLLHFSIASLININDSRSLFGFRTSLGFSHPNTFGRQLMVIGFAVAILWGTQKRGLTTLCLLGLSILTFALADSRTSLLGIFLTIGIIWLKEPQSPYDRNRLFLLVEILVLLLFCFSIYVMVFYNPESPFFNWLNKLTSYRAEFWHGYYSYYSLSLFGCKIDPGVVRNIYGGSAQLDGSYPTMLLEFGLVPTLIFMCLIIALFEKAKKSTGSIIGVLLLFTALLIGLFENSAFSLSFNFLLLELSCIVLHTDLASFVGENRGAKRLLRNDSQANPSHLVRIRQSSRTS